ncbi:MAG: 1-acyl-sn-glycerol-3-phosphate acyltransferase [Deltaproteobacteria bacterium]
MLPLRPGPSDDRDEARIARIVEIVETVVQPYFRAQVRGAARPPDGPALYVGNHNAGLLAPEAFLFGAAMYRAHGLAGVPFFLAGDLVVDLPVLKQLAVPLGAVRARHGTAERLLAQGDRVFVYPGGDLESMRAFRDRDRIVFGGRRGYVRLAVRTGVPVVPVVTAGAHATCVVLDDGSRLVSLLRLDRLLRVKTWPITLCLPWGLLVGPALLHFPWPTRILQEILEPIRFGRSGDAAAADDAYVRACAGQVEATMQAALTRLAAERAAS